MSADVIEWAKAGRALPGQGRSGDLHVIAPFPGGVLAAVIDGLGHGVEAAAAAELAAATISGRPHEPVIQLVRLCHEELNGTRGAVMSLASFDVATGLMTWIAVGNVEGVLLRTGWPDATNEGVVQRGGVVGYRLPTLLASVLPVSAGDTLIMATDGIDEGFVNRLSLDPPLQRIADDILAGFAKDADDSLVLLVRYKGNGE